MDHRIAPLLWEAVHRTNVLPLTSRCNVACVFCSHRQNPPGVESYAVPPLSLEQVIDMLPFFNGEQKIVIGESATRLREGEPFTHPELFTILGHLRRHYPSTVIQLTTNGILLSKEKVRLLAELQPVELVLSVNSITNKGRRLLMGTGGAEQVRQLVAQFGHFGISFHGSVVAMPHLLGWKDLKETLNFLESGGARTTRIFLPGFTGYTRPELCYAPELRGELASFVQNLQVDLQHTLLPEPPLLNDLQGRVEGVLPGGAAAEAGVRRGDLLREVNGVKVFSRVHAFQEAEASADPELVLEREGREIRLRLEKQKNKPPGFVVHYDLDPAAVRVVEKEIARRGSIRPLLLTSPAAYDFWQEALRMRSALDNLTVGPVPSRFFGGTINSAGLLTMEDFDRQVRNLPARKNYDLIILPPAAFDRRGRDLRGIHYLEMENETGIPAAVPAG